MKRDLFALEEKCSELESQIKYERERHRRETTSFQDMCVDIATLLGLPHDGWSLHQISSALSRACQLYAPLNLTGKPLTTPLKSPSISMHSSSCIDEHDEGDDDVEKMEEEDGYTPLAQRKLLFPQYTPNAASFGDFEGTKGRKRKDCGSDVARDSNLREGKTLGEVKKALKDNLNDKKFSISLAADVKRSWVTTFVQTCRSFKCNDDELLNLFKLSLDNSCANTTLGFLSSPFARTWGTLFPYLRKMCQIPEPQEALTSLTQCKQGNRSIAEFYAAFRTLLMDCGEKNVTDDQQVHHFVQGLTDPNLRRKCLSWEKNQRAAKEQPNLEDVHIVAMENEKFDIKAKGSKKRDTPVIPRMNVNHITHQPYDVVSDEYDPYDGVDYGSEMNLANAVRPAYYQQPPMGYSPFSYGYAPPPNTMSSHPCSTATPIMSSSSSSSSSSLTTAQTASSTSKEDTNTMPSWFCTPEWVEKNLFNDARKRPTKGSKILDVDKALDFEYLKTFCWEVRGGSGPSRHRYRSSFPILTDVTNNTVCDDCGARADHITEECRYRPSSACFLYFGSEYKPNPVRATPAEMEAPPADYWKQIAEKRKKESSRSGGKKSKP